MNFSKLGACLCLAIGLWAADVQAQAVLIVEASPGGATVRVDGRTAGIAPVTVDVAPGEHDVEALFSGFAPATRTVTVAAGDTLRVALELEQYTGVLDVAAVPPGARVVVDGVPVEGLPVHLGAGTVEVRVEVPGRRPVWTAATVAPDTLTRVAYRTDVIHPATMGLAALLPGGVQAADGRPLVGTLLLGAAVGTAVGVGLAHGRAAAADADRAAALAVYDRATTEQAAVEAREAATAATADARAARSMRRAFLGAAAAVYLVSVADAFVHHVRRPDLAAPPPVEIGAGPGGVALRIRL